MSHLPTEPPRRRPTGIPTSQQQRRMRKRAAEREEQRRRIHEAIDELNAVTDQIRTKRRTTDD